MYNNNITNLNTIPMANQTVVGVIEYVTAHYCFSND